MSNQPSPIEQKFIDAGCTPEQAKNDAAACGSYAVGPSARTTAEIADGVIELRKNPPQLQEGETRRLAFDRKTGLFRWVIGRVTRQRKREALRQAVKARQKAAA